MVELILGDFRVTPLPISFSLALELMTSLRYQETPSLRHRLYAHGPLLGLRFALHSSLRKIANSIIDGGSIPTIVVSRKDFGSSWRMRIPINGSVSESGPP
jgi:hypothetical protein